MKILRAITWLPPGGIERRLVAVLPRLRDRHDIEPEVVCLRERGPLAADLEAAGVPVHLCRMRSRWDPAGLWRLRGLIRRGGFDLVHAHMYRSNVPATVAARLAGVPMLGQVHNVDSWNTGRQIIVDRRLARWRAGMIAVSERVADDVVARLRLARAKVHVLYNGIDGAAFAPDATARSAARAQLGVEERQTVFLCPARLHPQKNHAGLLRAWEATLAARPALTPQPQLLLAGEGKARGEIEAQLAALSERNAAIGATVRLVGHRDDMTEMYRAADVMVLPSFKEGFSNALLEAMAAGLAVVASDVGGNAEAVEDGRSGLIVAPGDDQALAAALGIMIDAPEERERLAEGARERSRRFSLDAMAERTAALYREVLAGRGASGEA